jgi:hypothetical protein
VKTKSKSRRPSETADVATYRRPSKWGGNGGKRELVVTSLARLCGYYARREQRVPYIRMSGIWLQQLGFQRGHRIAIPAEHQRLMLTVVPDEAELPINCSG